MEKQLFFRIAFTILACTVLWACKKDKSNNVPTESLFAKLKMNSGTTSFPCDKLPSIENGILTFKDASQYRCYEEYLTNLVNNFNDTTMSEDDALEYIENALGFHSLRAEKLAEFEALNAIGWATAEEVPAEDWITSKVRRSILNTDREVKIGSYIEKRVSQRYLVTLDADKPDLLSSLRELPENSSVDDIINLDLNRKYISISSMQNPDEVYAARGMGGSNVIDIRDNTAPVPVFWTMSGTVYEQDPCGNAGRFRFSGFTTSRNLVPQKCTYHIEYGDGTSSTPDIVSNYGTNQSLVPEFQHSYAPGSYTATVSVKSISPNNSGSAIIMSRSYPIVAHNPQPICSQHERSRTTLHYLNTTNILRGYIHYRSWYTWPFRNSRTQVNGYTDLLKFDSNNNYWKRVKNKQTNLCISLIQDLTYDNCSNKYYEPFLNKCSKNTYSKVVEATYYGGEIWYLNKLKGIHSVSSNGGISGQFEHSLIICQ